MKQQESKDRELIKMVLDGNSDAFKVIINNTQGLVLQIIYKMVRSVEDREDLVQDVYFKVYDKLAGFKFNSKLSTWIGTITYNTCLHYLEKKKITILDIHSDNDTESWESIGNRLVGNTYNSTEVSVFNKERFQILQNEIEKLSPLYQIIITLYHNEELSYEEISRITNLPEGTLKSYLFRARKKLKHNLLLNYKKEDL